MSARSSCNLRKTSSCTTGREIVAGNEVSENGKMLCLIYVFKNQR